MRCILVVAALTGFLLSSANSVQAYPDRPVRMIVPFAPGGITDISARLLGQYLSAKWRQQVVIENKPGASGIIGIDTLMQSAPDGYAILLATNGEIAINPAVNPKLRYDSQKDLVPIAMVTSTPFVWSANLNSGIGSLQELVAAAKAKPGGLAYSSAGIASSGHMATEQFAAATGIKLLHVPYRGGGPAAAAIVSGDVPVSAVSLSAVLSIIDSGKVKPLAITALRRSSLVPNVPTVGETGVLPQFQSAIWTGLFAPVGTPDAIIANIEADTIEVLKDPALISRLQQVGADPVAMPRVQLRAQITKEIDELRKIAAAAGIRLE